MAAVLKYLSEIDAQTKHIVHGFIRMHFDMDVPADIVDLFFVYYHAFENWTSTDLNVCMTISSEKRELAMIKNGGESAFNYHGYGSKIIKLDSLGVYRWKLEVGGCAHVKVGLAACESNGRVDTKLYNCMLYGYNGLTGKQYRKARKVDTAQPFCPFDVVEIELNTNSKKLKFYLNGKRQGRAMKTFNDDERLILAVAMMAKDNWIRILQFSKT